MNVRTKRARNLLKTVRPSNGDGPGEALDLRIYRYPTGEYILCQLGGEHSLSNNASCRTSILATAQLAEVLGEWDRLATARG